MNLGIDFRCLNVRLKFVLSGLNGVGWRASARSALLVGKDAVTGETAICQTKSNLGVTSRKSFGFKIISTQIKLETLEEIDAPEFSWTGKSSLTEGQMLSSVKNEDDRAERSEAVELLTEALKLGEQLSEEVKKEARKLGITDYAFRQAKLKLNIKSEKRGGTFGGNPQWFLRMPGAKDVENAHKDVY